MLRILLYLFFAVSTMFAFGQTNEQTSIFKPAQSGAEQKVIINVSEHSRDEVGELKDKLLGYEGRIVLVHYDELVGIMTVIYNENMDVTILAGEFKKSGFEDVLNPVSKGINETE